MTVNEACERIAAIAADYRKDQIEMAPQRVRAWVDQFPSGSRLGILTELVHVLDNTYISRKQWEQFLKELLTTEQLVGPEPAEFWRTLNFFDQQKRGSSQQDMLAVFDEVLQSTFGFDIQDCGSDEGPSVYLDDAIFTGTHVRWDLVDWIKTDAPESCELHIIVIAHHPGRLGYTERTLQSVAKEAGKKLKTKWWSAKSFEVRQGRDTEILHPRTLPR